MPAGTLYIIGSPIGNLEDLTFRALRILKEETGCVYCEDTRQTRKLLNHYGINLRTESLHAHSPEHKVTQAINFLLEGSSISYLTDSGTPGISDPGSRLVKSAHEHGIRVVPVPGPSALASLMSVSGFMNKNIIFTGFLSKKESRKKRELEKFKNIDGIIIMYESPYRIIRLLGVLAQVFPGSMVVIGREMTKIHEEFIRGSIEDVLAGADTITEKGEFSVALWNEVKEEQQEHKNKYENNEDDDDDAE